MLWAAIGFSRPRLIEAHRTFGARVELRGITWDHVRGWGGMRAAADAYAIARPDVRVTWDARSLQSFADQPVEDLARYDLIVLDHPSIGEAVARGSLVALDEHIDAAFLDDQRSASVGRSSESYEWAGHRWALAVDAAAQVAACRPDLMRRAGVEVPSTWDDGGENPAQPSNSGKVHRQFLM